jgi:hypothetical protein
MPWTPVGITRRFISFLRFVPGLKGYTRYLAPISDMALMILSSSGPDDAAILFERSPPRTNWRPSELAYFLKRRAAVVRARTRLFGAAQMLLEVVKSPGCNYYKTRAFPTRAHHLYNTFPAGPAVEGCQ